MFRNYLAAALRNLARNRLHSAITTISLAVGFAAVIVAVLFWRYDHSYDRMWPNAGRIYSAVQWFHIPNEPDLFTDTAPTSLAPVLEKQIPGLEAVTRIVRESMQVANGGTEAVEGSIYWADANFFDVMQAKAISGDLHSALTPGSVVLTKAMAEKYFGAANPLGQPLTLTRQNADKEVMATKVTAVIEDWPLKSHIQPVIFVAVRDRARFDNAQTSSLTYFRVRPGVTAQALKVAFKDFSKRLPPKTTDGPLEGKPELKILPLVNIYLRDAGYGTSNRGMTQISHGSAKDSSGNFILGGLILAIATINFITLMTARGARRAVEVGVRKAAGARRRDLVVQFMGEGLVYTGLAFLIALALVEFSLPLVAVNTDRPLTFSYLKDADVVGWISLGAVAIGLIAGLYPALALSAFKPASVLKGGLARTPGSARLRQILIGLQFTPVILLAFSALTQGLQAKTTFDNSLKMLDPDALMIRQDCTPGFKAALTAIPGVRNVTCTQFGGNHQERLASAPIIGGMSPGARVTAQGRELKKLFVTQTDREGLAFFDLQPIIGRLWGGPEDDHSVIVNESGARLLGYAKPQAAVGHTVEARVSREEPMTAWPILAVVPDRGGVAGFEPALYFHAKAEGGDRLQTGVKLAAGDRAATLAAIDRAWAATGAKTPIKREFYRDFTEKRFAGRKRALQFQAACVTIGLLIATFGLFGLAAFLAEQRTKEVGVRKALGAGRGQLLRMLVFQFAKPVLAANILAIPLIYAVNTWTQREYDLADRVAPGLPLLIPVVIGSLLVTLIATFGHAWQVTGARPVTALRYE